MIIYHWLLLVLSAVLYALPFFYTRFFWWAVFIFPMPLLYVALKNKLTFLQGYLWGIAVFGLHLSGVIINAMSQAQGPWYIKILPFAFIVLYESIFAGLFFAVVSCITKKYAARIDDYCMLFIWISGLFCFVYFIDFYCLFLFDRCEGYFLMHPLLPLAQHPQLLSLMPLFGKQLLTVFLLLVSCVGILVVLKKNSKTIFYFCTVLLFWLISFFLGTSSIEKPVWLSSIVPYPIVFSSASNLTAQMTLAGKMFKKLVQNSTDVSLIVLPESAFYSDHLSMPELTQHWSEQHLSKKVHIIAGAFRWHEQAYYNSLHWIYDGTLQQCFDKRHAMLLTERVPSFFYCTLIRDLYFKKFPELTASKKERPQLQITEHCSFVPYICSELFFNEYPDDVYPETPILAISNDRWFTSYVHHLMYLNAKFKAIQWQRPIIYISFFYQAYIDVHGTVIPIEKAKNY